MSGAARAVGNFFGVGSASDGVIQQWKTLAEKKLKVSSDGVIQQWKTLAEKKLKVSMLTG